MKMLSSVPHVAIAAGMPGRYRYWTGRSGARYLFTQVAAKSLEDFDDGVFLLVRFGTIQIVGNRGTVSAALADGCHGAVLYVHLLATSEASHSHIIDDLIPHRGNHGFALAA
jgi:hypothetical protein